MGTARWVTFSTLLLLATAGSSTAFTNRVFNGDFETAGANPTLTPGWEDDGTLTARVDGLGASNSAGLLVVGVGRARSAELFPVTPGETLELAFEVWEVRDDSDGRPGFRGDSVLAIEFVNAAGGSPRQLEFHCDAYVDLLDNNALDESDTCTLLDGYVAVRSAQTAITCPTPECQKYAQPIVVPPTAVFARIVLGGSLATDTIDPLLTGLGVSSPTSLAVFDNVVVGN